MYAVSSAYKDWILNNPGSRQFNIRATLSTPTGDLSLTDTDFVMGDASMNEAVVSGDMVEVGSVFSADLTITIFNNKSIYTEMSMRGSRLFVEVGYVLEDDSTEWVPLGRFIVTECSMPTNTITLKCMDYMILFEKPWADVTLTFPATVSQILTAVCSYCGVTLESTTGIANISYSVLVRPDDETLTCRDIISYCAALCGKNARMTRTGTLELVWYGDNRQVTEGYVCDGNTAVLDGGTPTIPNLAVFDGGYQSQPAMFYELEPKDRTMFSLDSGQIVLTGLIYENENQVYVVGSDHYAIRIDKNPLLQTAIEATLLNVFNAIGYFSYMPYSATAFGDPARQAGDLVAMTNTAGKTFNTIVTSNKYRYRGAQSLQAIGRSVEIVDYRTTTDKRIVQVDQTSLKQGAEYNAVSIDSDNGFVCTATIGGKTVTVKMSATDGLAFYDGSTYRGGLEVVNSLLTLATDILKSPGFDNMFVQFEPVTDGGVDYQVLNFYAEDSSTESAAKHFTIKGYVDSDTNHTILESKAGSKSQGIFEAAAFQGAADGQFASMILSATAANSYASLRTDAGTEIMADATGIYTAGIPVYANNAAAITGGLDVGYLYRTGGDPDVVCVVH